MEIKAVAFDGDGTFYNGDELFPEIPRLADWLIEKEVKLFLTSNHSSGDVNKLAKRVRGFIPKANIINAGSLLLSYIETNFRSVFVIGTDDFKEKVESTGIKLSDKGEAVVVAYTEDLDYNDFRIATELLLDKKPLLAASMDRLWMDSTGEKPGIGMLVRALSYNLNIRPKVFGKPNVDMFAAILKREKILPSQLLVVGDVLETDILAANRIGAPSVFVDSGTRQVVKIGTPTASTTHEKLFDTVHSFFEE